MIVPVILPGGLNFLITGGAGFIGSAVIRHIINNTDHNVVNVDKLTYAGNLESLASIESDARYTLKNFFYIKNLIHEIID